MTLGTPITPRQWPFPDKAPIHGQYVQLVPLSMSHLDDLWAAAKDEPDSFTYLRYGPFASKVSLKTLISDLSTRAEQPFWAVITNNGQAMGWLSICDIYQNDGAFEIGSIWFSPSLQGTRNAREAIFLLMQLGMDDLGYERLVWRCHAQNQKSFTAAINLGFQHEGTWRNAVVVDGWQRDIAWFSILKSEWPNKRDGFTAWLNPENFNAHGNQRRRLSECFADQI